jgi:pyrroline-5-carboxylate reductase
MRIGIIGCGNMGGAIACALVKAGFSVISADHTREKVEKTGARYADVGEVLRDGEVVILAVKPQTMPSLLPSLKGTKTQWISVVTGYDLKKLSQELGTHEIVRFMPNVAAKAGASVTAVTADPSCSEGLRSTAMKIADTFGSAFELSEAMMPAFIGISGSGIAYVFQFLHAMALGGTREGIPYQKSLQIACDTLLSAVMLQKQSGQNPIDLLSSVCSAGGTTIEGIEALEKNAFDHAVIEAVTVAAEKSKRL